MSESLAEVLAHGASLPREFNPNTPAEPEWMELIQRLWQERDSLVSDFLERFASISYEGALVPDEDVHRTAADTMEMFLFLLAGLELPADLQSLPRDVAARRARQGVPMEAFLSAVRNDFRVLWKGLERVARGHGTEILVANMDRVLDTVENYVSSIQQAFSEEEALLARDKQLHRQRLLSRLFNTDTRNTSEMSDIAAGLEVQSSDVFEMMAVTRETAAKLPRQPGADRQTFSYERAGALYLFRVARAGRTWQDDPPEFPAGYVPGVEGLAAIPQAAASALVLATKHGEEAGLATVPGTWMTIARDLLENALPGFSHPITAALDHCTPHERQRLLQVARSYGRTGSIKETAEELYCHRNTVVNRLHSLEEVIGLDLTVPAQAALALVALADYKK
ncbi:helix-turn-helix domain-containing protein [Arthrobacter sulfonylureivorans]|uniref:helix-turn-helix domain-containing protein n=1 Tax=Arthrobacter sulfonylureivorans TaxID=2486855 RepID=UPI0039E55DE3